MAKIGQKGFLRESQCSETFYRRKASAIQDPLKEEKSLVKTAANRDSGADKQRDNSKPEVIGRPWQPGQSGNPAGRPPRDKCIPDVLRRIGDEEYEGTRKRFKEASKMEVVLRVVFERAMAGHSWAVQFIADRLEGRPRQEHEIQTNGAGIFESLLAMPPEELRRLRDEQKEIAEAGG